MGVARIAVLFPGQGAVDLAALRSAQERHPAVRAVFDQIEPISQELYARSLSDVLFGPATGDAPSFGLSQLAVYGSALAAHQVLRDAGIEPDALLGHSLGEIAALAAASAYTIADGARVVALRSLVLERSGVEGGMVALSADAQRSNRIIELIEDAGLAVAVDNHAGQTVISGPHAALSTVRGIAQQLRVATVELEAAYPFHNPLLATAAADFALQIKPIVRRPVTMAVYSPILSRYYQPDDDLPQLLADQLVKPVAFGAALRHLYEDGHHVFVEAGGRDALTRLVSHAVTAPGVRAMATFSDSALDATLPALRALTAELGQLKAAGQLLLPEAGIEEFRQFWASHGDELRQLAAQRFRSVPPADAVAVVAVDPAELRSRVQALYAETLEYPVEVFTDDALLEAELGVDSVKQVELLSRLYQQLGLHAQPADLSPGSHDTVGKIVETVGAALNHSRP